MREQVGSGGFSLRERKRPACRAFSAAGRDFSSRIKTTEPGFKRNSSGTENRSLSAERDKECVTDAANSRHNG
jgi:hypothetical protein